MKEYTTCFSCTRDASGENTFTLFTWVWYGLQELSMIDIKKPCIPTEAREVSVFIMELQSENFARSRLCKHFVRNTQSEFVRDGSLYSKTIPHEGSENRIRYIQTSWPRLCSSIKSCFATTFFKNNFRRFKLCISSLHIESKRCIPILYNSTILSLNRETYSDFLSYFKSITIGHINNHFYISEYRSRR